MSIVRTQLTFNLKHPCLNYDVRAMCMMHLFHNNIKPLLKVPFSSRLCLHLYTLRAPAARSTRLLSNKLTLMFLESHDRIVTIVSSEN